MTRAVFVAVQASAFVLGMAAAVHAQSSPDPTATPWTDAKIKMGPIFFNPAFNLKDVGVDQNVFDDPQFPKRDITGTLAMTSLGGLHFGDTLMLLINQETSYVWYRRYRSERSIDGALGGILELRTGLIHPWLRIANLKTHARTGYEIDARAGRTLPSYELGSDLHFGPRLGATVAYTHNQVTYAPGEMFDNVDLPTALNSTSTSYRVAGRYDLSAFTDLVGGAQQSQENFQTETIKNSTSRYYFGGFEAKHDAIISGGATIGYRIQQHQDPTVPSYRGLVGSGDVSFVVKDRAKFELTGNRDLGDSYEAQYPFYIQQGVGVNATTRWAEHVDMVTNATAEWLLYRLVINGPPAPRTDRNYVFDLGFGYFLGGVNGTRVGFTIERRERRSPIAANTYHTTRLLTNLKFSF